MVAARPLPNTRSPLRRNTSDNDTSEIDECDDAGDADFSEYVDVELCSDASGFVVDMAYGLIRFLHGCFDTLTRTCSAWIGGRHFHHHQY